MFLPRPCVLVWNLEFVCFKRFCWTNAFCQTSLTHLCSQAITLRHFFKKKSERIRNIGKSSNVGKTISSTTQLGMVYRNYLWWWLGDGANGIVFPTQLGFFSPRHASLAKPPGLPGVDPWPVPVVLQDDDLATGIGRKCEDLLFSWRMGSYKVMERDRDVGKKHVVCIYPPENMTYISQNDFNCLTWEIPNDHICLVCEQCDPKGLGTEVKNLCI